MQIKLNGNLIVCMAQTMAPYRRENTGCSAISSRTTTKRTYKVCLKSAHTFFSPHHLLVHSLFVFNHLNTDEKGNSPSMKHWGGSSSEQICMVMWRDLLSGTWKGLDTLISSGRVYACVFPQDADFSIWISDRLIQPVPLKAAGCNYSLVCVCHNLSQPYAF